MTVAKVSKPLRVKTKEMEEVENVALKSLKSATKKAYLGGYMACLINLEKLFENQNLNKQEIMRILKIAIEKIERGNEWD